MLFSELFEQHFLVLVDFAHIWFFRSYSHTANNSHAACSMSEKQKINGEWTCSRSAKQILMFGYFFSSSFFWLALLRNCARFFFSLLCTTWFLPFTPFKTNYHDHPVPSWIEFNEFKKIKIISRRNLSKFPDKQGAGFCDCHALRISRWVHLFILWCSCSWIFWSIFYLL